MAVVTNAMPATSAISTAASLHSESLAYAFEKPRKDNITSTVIVFFIMVSSPSLELISSLYFNSITAG